MVKFGSNMFPTCAVFCVSVMIIIIVVDVVVVDVVVIFIFIGITIIIVIITIVIIIINITFTNSIIFTIVIKFLIVLLFSLRNQRYVTIHPKQTAQYVRIQLAGTITLLLAEVEIRGFPPIQTWQHLEGPRKWTQVLNHISRVFF